MAQYKIKSNLLSAKKSLGTDNNIEQIIHETLALYDKGEDLTDSPFIQAGEWKYHKDCYQAADPLKCALARQQDIIKLYASIKKKGYNGSTILAWFDDEGLIHLYDGFHRIAVMSYLGLVDYVNVETSWKGLDDRVGRDFPLVDVLKKEAPGGEWLYQPVDDDRLKGWKLDRKDSPQRLEYILNNLTGNTVLDIGCSEGYFSREIARKGYKVTAIDQRAGLIAAAKYLSILDGVEVDYRVGEWHDILSKLGSFDNILFLSILHNDMKKIGVEKGLEKLQAFQGKAKRVFFEVPNNSNEKQWMRDGFPKFNFHTSQALISDAMGMEYDGEYKGLRSIFLLKETAEWREITDEEWDRHQATESHWWGTCQNTLDNQIKQQTYAKYMGLNDFDLKGKSILDIGGGPVSILLRCQNFSRAVVLDPCDYPNWVTERYKMAGIELIKQKAEEAKFDQKFDEAWIYNCLQHVQDPEKAVDAVIASAHMIRICEPRCEVGVGPAHPHNLTKGKLDRLFHRKGTAESIPLATINGNIPTKLSYYGIFDYKDKENTPMRINGKFRLHVLGLAHTKTNKDYSMCAYTQKVYKMCQMMMDLGHEVYHYGAEGSNPPCTENVQVISDAEQKRVYGDFDWHKYYWKYSANDEAYKIFNRNAIREINRRKQPRDLLLISNGVAQKAIADAVSILAIEAGIGYTGVFANYKVFESYAWMHHIYGMLYAPKRSCDIRYYDCVIPNYFDPSDFEYSDKKDGYYLFMGRLIPRKGYHIAAQVVERIGGELILAGQGDLPEEMASPNIRHIGTVDAKGRSALMKNAKALFVPTTYLEPFGGVAIEANFCGTPVITTDFGAFTETVRHSVTGYRCRTIDDFIWAA